MATFEQPGICSIAEYSEALSQRRDEKALEIGEIAVIYLRVKNVSGLAHRLSVRVSSLANEADPSTARSVELDLVNAHFKSIVTMKGYMFDGIWNCCNENGEPEDLSMASPNPNFDHVLVDGCLTTYEDGLDSELDEIMAKELVHVRSMPLTSQGKM